MEEITINLVGRIPSKKNSMVHIVRNWAMLKITNRYGIVPNQLLNDPSISWKAKWLFGYLQSKPEDRDFATDRIRKDSADGRDSTTNWIKELEKAWYLQRTKRKNERWQRDIEYTLYDTPITGNPTDLHQEWRYLRHAPKRNKGTDLTTCHNE